MEEKKSILGLRYWLYALGTALVALVVYACTLAGHVFPGQSTHLFTQWMGMDALSRPASPLWGSFVKMVVQSGFGSSMALRMNLFSLICGVLATGCVTVLVSFFVRRTIRQEESAKCREGAATIAGLVAGLAFIFSPAVWQASTHLEYQMFDLCYALLLFLLFIPMAKGGKLLTLGTLVLGVGVGLGLVESPIFVPLTPVYLLALLVTSVRAGKSPYLAVIFFLLSLAVSFLVYAHMVASAFLQLPEAAASKMDSSLAVTLDTVRSHLHEVRSWLTRPGWLYIIIFTVLPFAACMFAAPRGLNNERSWSQYLFHAAMTVCTLLALATPLNPENLMRPFGISPVVTTTLAVVVAGYLSAYWLVLFRTEAATREGNEVTLETRLGGRLAPIVLGIFLVLLLLSSLVNTFGMSRDRGAFADICANEIMDRLGARTWFVTDGMLDDHLRIVASSRKKELNLICLQRDTDEAYLRELGALVKEKKLKAGVANLGLSVELGVLPFLQDWFGGDPKVTESVAVFGVPDLWYMADKAAPLPEGLFFGGVKDLTKTLDGAKAKADFLAFWKKMEPVLTVDRWGEGGKGSRSIGQMRDPVAVLCMQLRRHMGFLANNLGVVLQDLKLDKDAFDLYELVLKTIDPDNISALFNEFEMARAGVPAVAGRQAEITKQLQAIVDDSSRRYALWSLARYYGYIRSAEIFARMGYGWAHSAVPGNAISHLEHARDLVAPDRQNGLVTLLANAYANANETQKSRELYQKVLAEDGTNHDAYMGLMRLALQKGDYAEAMKCLELAMKNAKNSESAGFDQALLSMMKNDLDGARMSLQKVTDLQPKSLQAWSLLAGVLLQQYDQTKDAAAKKKALDELEGVILPKMQSLADSPRDYYVHMTRALVLLRKGPDARKDARDALIVASRERPDVSAVSDMILNLDIQMDDPENAERHARQVLRQNRQSKLANYVMGSIRLRREDYATAETFLRLSVNQERPLASAQNDLAEALRRQKKFVEAEKAARDAVKNEPNLYVAWETLASILLDQGKKETVAEAEAYVTKAIELVKKVTPEGDLRMLLTLARAQLAKGDLMHFNVTMRTLNSKRDKLQPVDQAALDEIQKSARGKH